MPNREARRPFSFLITVLAGSSAGHLIRQLHDHSLDYRYAGRVVGTVVVSMILEPFRWWEALRWRKKIKETAISKPPVFVIGFWRSGTTLLHNLLCQIPGAAYVTTYQTVFPDLLLSHSWWFKPIIGKFWPTNRPFDDVKMGMDLPQEEEIALANLQKISFYNFLCFPRDFNKFYEKELFLKGMDEKDIEKWKSEYSRLVRKAILNTGGEMLMSKSPSNMARIGKILEMFPDAKFIFIFRDPYKTAESFYRFFHEVVPVIQLQELGSALSNRRMCSVYADMIRQYLRDKDLIPPENLVEIRFEDFTKNVPGTMESIFNQFGWPDFDNNRLIFEQFLTESARFKQHSYEISDDTVRNVNDLAGDIVEKLDYQRRVPSAH